MTQPIPEEGKPEVPPTEVKPRATRRRFTAKYKQSILEQADACSQPGELGALLRRDGLYSSHISSWRAQRERGGRDGLAPKKRGPKAAKANPLDKVVRDLERENQKLLQRARRAEALVEVQKKVSELLGIVLPTPDSEEENS